jgi:probable F420-dependent oxidoreductase
MTNSPRPFRFGIINEQVKPREEWLAHVRRAEALGYDTFLIRDHFVPDFFGDQLAPLVALMAAASATTRLHVGTLVLDNDYRHPVMLAKEAATLDMLSGGRFELGIGAGWLRTEYEQAGMSFDSASVRISRLEEALHIIKGLFGDAPFSFSGQHYTIHNLNGCPKPACRPPLLIGAGQKRMLMLAGREADIVGILTTSVASGTLSDDPTERLAASVRQKIEWIRDGAGERFSQIELCLIPTIAITDDRRRWAEQHIAENGWEGIAVEDVLDMPSRFIGTLDEIASDMLARREQYGFSYYVIADRYMETAAPLVERLSGR